MQYGLYETILTVKNLILTKLFYPNARLIRYPFFLRNGKFVHFGKGFTCGYNCRIESINCNNNYGKIKFGENVKIGDYVHIASASSVTIEDNVLIASHIFISDLDHGKYAGENQTSPSIIPDLREIYSKEVLIKENTWIGENVTILKGVTIGKGCIIGANSLVNKDIPDYSIVAGQPAKILKSYNINTKEWER